MQTESLGKHHAICQFSDSHQEPQSPSRPDSEITLVSVWGISRGGRKETVVA